jgi:hypothetical protein
LAPFSARGLLVDAHQRGIEHQVLVIGVAGERIEHLLPHPGLGPAGEALVHALPFAVPLGQVLPPCPGSQHPQNRVHKQPIIGTRAAPVAGLAGQQMGDPLPLRIGKFIPSNHDRGSRSTNLESHESHIPARWNP